MVKIAVCTQDEACREQLTAMLNTWAKDGSMTLAIEPYESAEAFLEEYESDAYAFIFLDTSLPDLSGLMLARRLRGAGENAQIVFLAENARQALACYETHPAGYFVKAVEQGRLFELLLWHRALFLPAMRYVTVTVARAPRRILLADILYIAVSGRTSQICLKNGETVLTNRTLNFLAKELGDAGFFRCHRSYLVNPICITAFAEHTLVLQGGAQIPVSEEKFSLARKAAQERAMV